jgi:hypothetical protein
MASKPLAPPAKKSGKTLDDLRAIHDKSVLIPNRIKAGLAKLAEDGWENWAYESDFMRLAGVSPADFRDYREQFADFWAEMPSTNGKRDVRKVWFATKKAADTWKGQ